MQLSVRISTTEKTSKSVLNRLMDFYRSETDCGKDIY